MRLNGGGGEFGCEWLGRAGRGCEDVVAGGLCGRGRRGGPAARVPSRVRQTLPPCRRCWIADAVHGGSSATVLALRPARRGCKLLLPFAYFSESLVEATRPCYSQGISLARSSPCCLLSVAISPNELQCFRILRFRWFQDCEKMRGYLIMFNSGGLSPACAWVHF